MYKLVMAQISFSWWYFTVPCITESHGCEWKFTCNCSVVLDSKTLFLFFRVWFPSILFLLDCSPLLFVCGNGLLLTCCRFYHKAMLSQFLFFLVSWYLIKVQFSKFGTVHHLVFTQTHTWACTSGPGVSWCVSMITHVLSPVTATTSEVSPFCHYFHYIIDTLAEFLELRMESFTMKVLEITWTLSSLKI